MESAASRLCIVRDMANALAPGEARDTAYLYSFVCSGCVGENAQLKSRQMQTKVIKVIIFFILLRIHSCYKIMLWMRGVYKEFKAAVML